MTDAPAPPALPRILAVCGDPVGRGALLALLTMFGGIGFVVLSAVEYVLFRAPFDIAVWSAAWGGILVSSASALGLHAWAGAKAQAAAGTPPGS